MLKVIFLCNSFVVSIQYDCVCVSASAQYNRDQFIPCRIEGSDEQVCLLLLVATAQ